MKYYNISKLFILDYSTGSTAYSSLKDYYHLKTDRRFNIYSPLDRFLGLDDLVYCSETR